MSEAEFAGLDPAVRISRRGPVGMITLRGDLGSPRLADAVAAASGCVIPERRRVVFAGDRGVAWMSPDELMLFVGAGEAAEAVAAIGAALGDMHHLVIDVSDARAVFRLEGAGAREVLAKGTPVDLDAGSFGPGDFRRSRLGQVAATFWMPETGTIDLMCFRSVAGFVAAWLTNAGRPGTLPGHLRRG
jgi:sarcosine oxidase, subunit gamma